MKIGEFGIHKFASAKATIRAEFSEFQCCYQREGIARSEFRFVLPAKEIAKTGTELDIRMIECSGIEVPKRSVINLDENSPAFIDTVVVATTTPRTSTA